MQLIETTPARSQAIILPGREAPVLRTWVQLVWNPTTSVLERQAYSVWDPVPSLQADLLWLPDNPANSAAGLIEGSGKLVFRRRGAASYDRSATLAVHTGEFRAGRAEGQGRFQASTGLTYTGEWRAGLMEGQGRLNLPNGDQYTGAFIAGQRNGRGLYIDATGALYEGGFADDLAEGQGIFAPAHSDPYGALWQDGREVDGSRFDPGWAAALYRQVKDTTTSEFPDVRLAVTVPFVQSGDSDALPFNYTSVSRMGELAILPESERLLNTWHGNENISMTLEERINFFDGRIGSFLGEVDQYEPVSLSISVENQGTETVSITDGYLQVASSTSNPEPAIQVRTEQPHRCGGGPPHNPNIDFDNFGWTEAFDFVVRYQFESQDGAIISDGFTRRLGNLESTIRLNFDEEMEALGVNSLSLSNEPLVCDATEAEDACMAEIRANGLFGALADSVYPADFSAAVNVTGNISYQWSDPQNNLHNKSSSFIQPIFLGRRGEMPECGEGGSPAIGSIQALELSTQGNNYRVPIEIFREVAPGDVNTWLFKVSAPQTSEHSFRVVLLLADGREVVSRPIYLTYFIPRDLFSDEFLALDADQG